jgi:hypothetical protein
MKLILAGFIITCVWKGNYRYSRGTQPLPANFSFFIGANMENRKWLKRKYPDSFDEINAFFNDGYLSIFKKGKRKMGRLVRDIIQEQEYPKGTILIFIRSNPINSFNYPLHHGIIKCKRGFTASGYHSIDIYEKDFEEILT